MFSDLQLTGIPGGGSVMKRLLQNGCDINCLRPYEYEGQTYMDKLVGNDENGPRYEPVPIVCNDSTLLYDEFKLVDTDVREVSRLEFNLWSDLRAAGMFRDVPNGLGYSVMQYQKVSDIGPASVGMDPIGKTNRDRPVVGTDFHPFFVIYKDWSFSLRDLEMSRKGLMPLDTEVIKQSTREIIKVVEQLTAGVYTETLSFGGGTVYGLTNFPHRVTGSMSDPTASGWTGEDFIRDILDMRAALKAVNHKGPFRVYVGTGWDQYIDEDYSSAKGSDTIRERAARTPRVSGIVSADYLGEFDVVMVEMNSRNIRAVQGMPITPVMWENSGGLELCGKLMAIMAPNCRADYLDQCGIAHYTVS